MVCDWLWNSDSLRSSTAVKEMLCLFDANSMGNPCNGWQVGYLDDVASGSQETSTEVCGVDGGFISGSYQTMQLAKDDRRLLFHELAGHLWPYLAILVSHPNPRHRPRGSRCPHRTSQVPSSRRRAGTRRPPWWT